jgi:hypothetical protein
MARRSYLAAAIVAAVGLAPLDVRAQPPASDLQAAEAFRQRLVTAIASGNRSRVAALFAFPMRVTAVLPYPIPIDNHAEFLRMYPLLFTAEMRCALEHSRMPQPGQAQPPWAMRVADGVVSLASGRVLATRTPAGMRVTGLTILGAPGSAAGRTTKVGFRWGAGQTRYTGRLALSQRDRYTLSARKGALLRARIERFPGRTLQLAVTQRATKQQVRGGPGEFARSWAARLPEDGEYDVEVVRRAPYCDPPVEYLLTLALEQ